MNEGIRQSINSFIYSLSSQQRQYEYQVKQLKRQVRAGKTFSGNLFAAFTEDTGSKGFARWVGSELYERNVQYNPENDLQNWVSSEFVSIKSFLRTISVKGRGKIYESGEKYVHRLEADTIGAKPKRQISAATKLLRELAKKEIIYSKDIAPAITTPKLARNISALEHIKIAKKHAVSPETAIKHVRIAIGLLLQDKFGFDVTSLPKFTKICSDCGMQLPRFLETFYDMGSKNIHRGRVPSSSDAKSAIAFVEGLEEELTAIPIDKEKLEAIRKRCEIEGVIFKEKTHKI